MTERKPPGVSFETWVEHQITQARERGDLDVRAGRPLPARELEETAYEWALKKARREGVETGDMLPPGLRLRRERDELPERTAGLPSEADVRALAEDYNARVEAFWRRPQESRWAPLPGLADVEALVAAWRSAHPPAPPGPEVTEVAVRRRFAWLRLRRQPAEPGRTSPDS
ncbi:DUF1992 domain-containing protein [Blastococcus sp. CCUG 61487]|uniref:DnaJ family domain-containing protein n=1 Tax=Blastococcus sp. CCUG 61487 TaxID=1840703 RepID=UPI001138312C|nr:DUF1992 domain-containing protein [Blastococcus sp. CCUG 61487]TKJ27416.1 hypothetical protein A6V29_03405 [Blastococcus sp. CCUG 61487]